MEGRLQSAKIVGADVVINCAQENLKERSKCCSRIWLNDILFVNQVMQETGGNGVGRLFEATGAATMINNCFALLRCAQLTLSNM